MTAFAPVCGMACLCPGVRLADMRLAPSGDGQYLLIYCRNRIVAILGSMGGDVDVFEFVDAGRLTAMELIAHLWRARPEEPLGLRENECVKA